MEPPFPKSYWLEPGRILCGEYPRDLDDAGGHAAMVAILKSGVREFIDLTEEGELKPYWEIVVTTARGLGIDPAGMVHRRFPVRDVSVPDTREAMGDILRAVRSARHRGAVIYIHCWGGRGRTGTVAGCLLAEVFDYAGDAALEKLKGLWSACAKSAYSQSPETWEQREFVHGWRARDRGEAVRGAMFGAAVGDALGVPVEFQGRGQRVSDPVTGMRGYGTHGQPAGTWSDDTSMLLATVAGFAGAGKYAPEAVMAEFARWVEEGAYTPHGSVFDIGIATRSAIRRYQAGTPACGCGGTGEMSNGNGSLMRILPVALAFADSPELVGKASEISSLTHAHERSRYCCGYYCLVVSELLHGGSLAGAAGYAWEVVDAVWDFSPGERVRFEALHPGRLLGRGAGEVGSSGHVSDTLEASLWANGGHGDYAGAVLCAVNLGEDTDTTGCVAGGLAGLIYGEGGIPEEWLEVLVGKEVLGAACGELERFAEEQIPETA